MPEPNMSAFDEKDFDCNQYVKDLVNEFVGGPELQQCRGSIQKLSDRTATELKRHVYDHYLEFVETSKEIKRLESETYQLSHHLAEQRRTLAELREENMTDEQRILLAGQDSAEISGEQANLRGIAAVTQALPDLSVDLSGKTYLHHGDLVELDSDTFEPAGRLRMFLFNDLLIVAAELADGRFRLQAQYEAQRVAVSNVRDREAVRNVVNLLTPTGSNIYCQYASAEAKRDWIDRFADAAKFMADPGAATASKKSSSKKNPAPLPPLNLPTPGVKSPMLAGRVSSESAVSPDSISSANLTTSPSVNYGPDWLMAAPEEILTLIAQRHFEETLQLVTRAEEYLVERDATFEGAADIAEKIKQQKANLATVLLIELSGSTSRSLNAALRTARRPLKLLGAMGKAREACGTLLRVCSSAIRASQRQARRNNLAISELFFCDLAHVAIEFLKAFANQTACVSTLVVWCNSELQYFASQLIKHYLNKGTNLLDVARCVEGVRKPCAQLTEIGLDLSYHMEGLLRNSLEQIIEESRQRLVETIGRTEEVWQPYNLQTTTRLRETLVDMDAMGIDMKSQVTGDTWIKLTASTVNFCRHFLSLTESCGVLAKNETLKLNVEVLLKDLFVAQYSIQPNAGGTSVDPLFVARNKSYLSDVLLPIAMAKFQNCANAKCELLNELLAQIQARNGAGGSSPRHMPVAKPRSVYRTDVI